MYIPFPPSLVLSARGIAADDCKEESVSGVNNKYAENFVAQTAQLCSTFGIQANKCFRQKCNCGERYVQSSINEWDCESGIMNNTFTVSLGEAIEFR